MRGRESNSNTKYAGLLLFLAYIENAVVYILYRYYQNPSTCD